jgi:CheY-like chemotaxis protein
MLIYFRPRSLPFDELVLPYLFTPFAQADRTLDRSQGGLGLGLALVKGLVELHPGGSVKATSGGTDQGTEFLVTLPTQADTQASERAPAVAGLPPALRVLVIEDIPDVADTLATLLALYGCTARVATSGAQGVEMAREFRPQVVLCDIGLPAGMSGLDVARTLRGDPATAQASLIAVSGYGADEDRRKSREAGFDQHLTKPVQPDHLLAALRATTSEGP